MNPQEPWPTDLKETRSADSGARVIAFVTDFMIVAALALVGTAIWATITPAPEDPEQRADRLVTGAYIAYVIVGAVYSVVSVTLWGQTPAKRFMNLKIVGSDGFRPTFNRAVGRHAASYLSLFFFIGYMMGLIRRDQRALHDLMAGTWVVRKPG